MKLTRAKFESLVEDLLQKTIGPVQAGAGRRRRSTPSQIDEVVLVGGSTRIPRVQQHRAGVLRQGAAQGREPGRGRGGRRGRAGGRARRAR